jgi:hypothetical protein
VLLGAAAYIMRRRASTGSSATMPRRYASIPVAAPWCASRHRRFREEQKAAPGNHDATQTDAIRR